MSRAITDCGCDETFGHRSGCSTLVALTWPDGTAKIAPVQGYSPGIPWSLHLEAYDAYEKKCSSQAALIDLDRRGCRGGFSTGELDDFIPGWRDRVGEIAHLRKRVAELEAIERIVNSPEIDDFAKGVVLEAAHQRGRWGSNHDEGKAPLDWFWLIGYLAQKAATAATAGDQDKALHHTISTAAALANWHLALAGVDNSMRPGIAVPTVGIGA